MLETIVLRFRDFGADSIAEHLQIIRERGSVWWGWWRKDEVEPDRLDVLEEFRALVASRGMVSVWLYDRPGNRFFQAPVVDCVLASKPGERIETPDKALTPTYYSQVPNPAWFRLADIKPVSPETFVKLVGGAPIGDATLYTIRQEGIGRTLEPGPRVEGPVPVRGNTIVHISDIHFGVDHGFPDLSERGRFSLLDRLRADIVKMANNDVALLVVSGDLTSRADGNQLLNRAEGFLNDLAAACNITTDQVIIVPGNHDIPLEAAFSPHDYSHEKTFSGFLRSFHKKAPPLLRTFQFQDGQRVEVLALSSVKLRDKTLMEYGYIEWPLYEGQLHSLAPRPRPGLRMAVMHHHLVPASRVEQVDPDYKAGRVSVTLDAGNVMEGLQEHDFNLVLHGHQHVPALTRLTRWRLKDDSPDLAGGDEGFYVVAGGSAGARATRLSSEMTYNSYGLLRLNNGHLNIRVRSFNPEAGPRDHCRAVLPL